jgi:ferric enterobactin receptor
MCKSIERFILSSMLILMVLALAATGIAQEKADLKQIKGIVTDASGGVLPGAQISIQGTELSSVTDSEGKFSLDGIPAGKITVVASLKGFADKEVSIEAGSGQEVNLDMVLEAAAHENAAGAKSAALQLMNSSRNIGQISFTPREIFTLPSLGEKDVFRFLQLTPGVSGSTENSSGLYVRGGTPGQNLVLFDGFTIYNVDHFFGVFSALNSNAVESATVYKGGFESKYGGRTSGVVDLVGRSGNKDEFSYGGGFSLQSLNGYLDGPLGRKGTLSLDARKSYRSPFNQKIRDNYTTDIEPGGGGTTHVDARPISSFYDFNARATYTPDNRNSFVLSSYYGADSLDDERTVSLPLFTAASGTTFTGETKNTAKWGNTGASLSWHRNWSNSFTSNITLAYSRYTKTAERGSSFTPDCTGTNGSSNSSNTACIASTRSTSTATTKPNPADTDFIETNKLNDMTFRWENNLALSARHSLEFGAEATRNVINYNFNFDDASGLFDRANTGVQQGYYVQDRYRATKKLEITPGVRVSRFAKIGKFYFEPRLAAIYQFNDRLRFKAAGGRYYQFIGNLTREDPLQGDQSFWTAADNKLIPVSSSDQYIAGVSYETSQYLFDVEAYRKELRGLTEFAPYRFDLKPGELSDEINFDKLFFRGTGRAEGVNVLLQQKLGANSGWLTYTLGRVTNDFPGISSVVYPSSYDSKHEVKIADSYRLKAFTFSADWIYSTGKPYTLPTDSDEITMSNGRTLFVPLFGAKNSNRLPAYHRLDLSASYEFLKRENQQARMGVSIYNAYKRKNIWRGEYQIFEGEIFKADVNYLGFTISAFVNVDFNEASAARRAGPAWTKAELPREANLKPFERSEKVYDFFGEVISFAPNKIRMQTKMGTQDFILTKDSILGESEYEKGAQVHVYYRKEAQGNMITMVVRKVHKIDSLLTLTQAF